MPPISAYVHYQLRVLERIAAAAFTPETIKRLSEEYDGILKAYAEGTDKRMEGKRAP